jgi:hypothetical protein
MGTTSVVYFEFMWWPHGLRGSGRSPYAFPFRISRLLIKASAIVSAVTIFVDFCLGVAFYSFLQTGYWRVTEVSEWVMAFTGTLYL